MEKMKNENENEMNSLGKKKASCFTKFMAIKQQCTQRSIQQQLQVAENILPEVREWIKTIVPESTRKKYKQQITFTDCLKIARLTPKEQLLLMAIMKKNTTLKVPDIYDYLIKKRLQK
ncbi:MAG: hypothetical protein ACFFDF_24905 [Candidatus Odinarchaeota archaeon]